MIKNICSCCNREWKNKHSLYMHIWYLKNKEKQNRDMKLWYYKNKEQNNIDTKNWYQENSEKHNFHIKERSSNPEVKKKIKKYLKKYHQTLRGKFLSKVYAHNRRIIENKFSKITVEVIQKVYERNLEFFKGLTCELCFKPIKNNEDSLEHFTPISRYKDFPNQDLNHINNLGVAHCHLNSKEKCNLHKLDNTLEEWFEKYPSYVIEGINKGYFKLRK